MNLALTRPRKVRLLAIRRTSLFDAAILRRRVTAFAITWPPWISKPRSTMSDEELKAELERLRNENAALKKGASSSIRLKVSEKGAVSVYGMGRFP